MSRATLASSDIAKHVRSVMKVVGGRPYQKGVSSIPIQIRVSMMRDRIGNASGREVDDAALRATAIRNYYRDIGDRDAADSWDAMAVDLGLANDRIRRAADRADRPSLPPGTTKG